jgi:ribosomal protein L37AE/L43A
MALIGIPGRKASAPPAPPAPLSRLEERREDLREQFTEMQWDLGGAAYEMAARDYFRLDVLASMAARLQVVDAELAEIERMARLEKAGAAGSCSGCGSLYARGAVYCWRCGRNLSETAGGTVVGATAAGQIAMRSAAPVAPATPAPAPAPAPSAAPEPDDDPSPDPEIGFRPAPRARRQ